MCPSSLAYLSSAEVCGKPPVLLPSGRPEHSSWRPSYHGCSMCTSPGLPADPASLGQRERLGPQQPHRFEQSVTVTPDLCQTHTSAVSHLNLIIVSSQGMKIQLVWHNSVEKKQRKKSVEIYIWYQIHIHFTVCTVLMKFVMHFPSHCYSLLQCFLLCSPDSQLGPWTDPAPPFLSRHQHHGMRELKPNFDIIAFTEYFTVIVACDDEQCVCSALCLCLLVIFRS